MAIGIMPRRLADMHGTVEIWDEIGKHLDHLDKEHWDKVAAKIIDVQLLASEIRRVRFTLVTLQNQENALLDEVDHMIGRW